MRRLAHRVASLVSRATWRATNSVRSWRDENCQIVVLGVCFSPVRVRVKTACVLTVQGCAGELYAHTDALPMTAHFAAVLLPGALQLSDGMRRDTPAGRDTRTLSQMRRQRERAWWDKEQAVPRSDERAMALFQDATLVPSGQVLVWPGLVALSHCCLLRDVCCRAIRASACAAAPAPLDIADSRLDPLHTHGRASTLFLTRAPTGSVGTGALQRSAQQSRRDA